MAKAVPKWAFDGGLMVKRRKELWVRMLNAVALFWRCWAFSGGVSRPPCGGCRSRRSSSSRRGPGPRASAADARRPGAGGSRAPADFTGCCPPTRPRRGSTSPPVKTSTRPTSRSRWPRAPLCCGPRSIRRPRVALRPNRIGTTRRRPPAGVWPVSRAERILTASSRRCRHRSAPTPHRSRRPAVAAAVEAVEGRRRRRRWWRRRRFMVTFVLILVLVLAVLVLIGFVVGYNKIRAADVHVEEALGGIDVQLTRRAAAHSQPGAHRRDLRLPRDGDPEPRHQCPRRANLGHQRGNRSRNAAPPSGNSTPRSGRCWRSGRATRSSTRRTTSSTCRTTLADTEDKLAFARQYYNDAVATCNRLISTIPWMFVAGLAGVSEREYYQTPR